MVDRRIKPAMRAPAAKPGAREVAKVSVVAEVKSRGDIQGGSSKESTLLERTFEPGQQAAFVRVGVGMTINTGNFESLRLDVAVTLPCLANEVDDAYVQASEYASSYLNEEQSRWLPNTKGR